MSTLTDRITDILDEHSLTGSLAGHECWCGQCSDGEDGHERHQADMIAAAVHPRIEAVAELDALPELTVIGLCEPGGDIIPAQKCAGEWHAADTGEVLHESAFVNGNRAGGHIFIMWTPEEES